MATEETRKKIAEAKRQWWASRTAEQLEEYLQKQRGPRPQTSEALKGIKRGPSKQRAGEEVPCTECGVMVYRTQYQLKTFPQAFCSRQCSADWRGRQMVSDNTVTCKNCGKEFKRVPSREKYNGGNHYCSKSCRNADYSGTNHHMWKGGRRVRSDGYVDVAKSLVPPAYHCMVRESQGVVLEHRLVMAIHLGRPLEDWEVVHHIDHNRSNNDISNLELHSHLQHTGITASENKITAKLRAAERKAQALQTEIEELKRKLSES